MICKNCGFVFKKELEKDEDGDYIFDVKCPECGSKSIMLSVTHPPNNDSKIE